MSDASLRNTGPVKLSKLSFVYIILSVVCTFSLLIGWVPVLHKQAFVTTIILVLSVLIVPQYFKTRLFFITVFYALVVWLNAQMGDEFAVDRRLLDGLSLCTCGCVSYYLMNSDDQRAKKWIAILVMIIIVIQTALGLVIYLVSHDSLRVFLEAMSHDQSDLDMIQLFRMGVLSYDVTHGLPVLIPPLIMWQRSKGVSKRWKLFCFICLFSILILTYIYDVTTVLLFTLFATVGSFLIVPNHNKRNKQRLIIVSLFALPFVFSPTLQDGALSIVENVTPGSSKEKIVDIRHNIKHGDNTGDIGVRKDKYTWSLNAFFLNPLVGVDDKELIGDHSAIFDRMGSLGLIGFIPYLLVLIISSRVCFFNIPPSRRWYYLICIIIFVALLILKNMSRLEEWFMFLVVAPSLMSINFDNRQGMYKI